MNAVEQEVQRVESPAVQAPVSNPSILDPRVERGAALLDERMPGWAEKVNPDTLSIDSYCGCVIGQTFNVPTERPFGAYADGLQRLGLDEFDTDEEEHGFYADPTEAAKITQDWRLAILSRRVLHTDDPSGSSPDSAAPARLREAAERSEHE